MSLQVVYDYYIYLFQVKDPDFDEDCKKSTSVVLYPAQNDAFTSHDEVTHM